MRAKKNATGEWEKGSRGEWQRKDSQKRGSNEGGKLLPESDELKLMEVEIGRRTGINTTVVWGCG